MQSVARLLAHGPRALNFTGVDMNQMARKRALPVAHNRQQLALSPEHPPREHKPSNTASGR